VGTIRSELKSVFEKLEISRQSELAALIARLAVLHPGNQNGLWQSAPRASASASVRPLSRQE